MDRLSTKGQMIDQIDLRSTPHSAFDRSNHNYGTGKLGGIIPVRLDEVYPGDRIKGRPEIVENFEPLVAPIMGNMVLKQESFFVPYIQLWRHAYKFFTGKNGFNDPMPSISPKAIWDIYEEYIHGVLWSAIGVTTDIDESTGVTFIVNCLASLRTSLNTSSSLVFSGVSNDYTLYQAFKEYVVNQMYSTFYNVYGSRKMLDLVMPLYKSIEKIGESAELIELSSILEDDDSAAKAKKQDACLKMAAILGDVCKRIFEFFHGASSLFDYLGWPTPVDFDYKNDGVKITIPEYGIYNAFQYIIYRNIFLNSSLSMASYVRGLFSGVSLVFNPFKAYYLVWYWNYRDQLLETGILDPEEDEFLGTNITSNVVLYCTMLRQRCWFKDTFTTALTNTGDGNLLVPISDEDSAVFVQYYDGDNVLINTTDHSQAEKAGATYMRVTNGNIHYDVPMNYLRGTLTNSSITPTGSSTNGFVSLDLFDRIKRLRTYVQKRLILGYEVDDVIYSSFMVTLSNVRMHVPEILGRGRDLVQINTVVNNTSTDQQIAGDKTATAWAHGVQSEMNYFSEEWGLFLTFTTTMPIQSYAGGMQRLYLKRDPLDYMWPEFATMGMDAVYNTELAALGTRLSDQQGLGVFGYQGRYYDLKSRQDEEHGRLLTDLNYLTFSREFDKDNPPKLNYMFVHCWPRLDGFVIEDPSMDLFRYDCYNAHGWERRLPVPSEIVS